MWAKALIELQCWLKSAMRRLPCTAFHWISVHEVQCSSLVRFEVREGQFQVSVFSYRRVYNDWNSGLVVLHFTSFSFIIVVQAKVSFLHRVRLAILPFPFASTIRLQNPCRVDSLRTSQHDQVVINFPSRALSSPAEHCHHRRVLLRRHPFQTNFSLASEPEPCIRL